MELLCYALLPIGFYRLQSRILNFRFKPVFYLPVYMLYYLLFMIQNYISELTPQLPLKPIFIGITILFPVFFYRDSIGKRILYSFLPYILYASCEILVSFIYLSVFRIDMSALVSTSVFHFTGILLSELLFIFLVEVFLHFFHREHLDSEEYQKAFLILLGIDIIFIAVLSGLHYYNNFFISTDFMLMIMFGCFLTMSLISIFIIYKVSHKSQELAENRLQMQQQEMEYQLTESLEDVTSNLRNLRHDMNNHFGILQGLLNLQEYNEASSYLKTIMEDLEVANQFTFVDNKMLSVLINSKISKASSLNIPIETEVLTNEFPMDDRDLISLVGNILENAIEACVQCEEPSIQFIMKKEGAHCMITCINTFFTQPTIRQDNFITIKEDKTLHGMGTKIIKSITKKHHGTVDFIVKDTFQVVVKIPY